MSSAKGHGRGPADVGAPPGRVRELEALRRVALAATAGGPLGGALRAVVDEVAALVPSQHVVLSPAGGLSSIERTTEGGDGRRYDAFVEATGLGAALRAGGRPARWGRAALERRAHPAGAAPPRGLLAAPVVGAGGEPLGLLYLCDKLGGDYDEDDERAVAEVARLASAAFALAGRGGAAAVEAGGAAGGEAGAGAARGGEPGGVSPHSGVWARAGAAREGDGPGEAGPGDGWGLGLGAEGAGGAATPAGLARANAWLAAAVRSALVGVAFVDKHLRYVDVNAALAAMSDLPREAHLGRRVDEVLPGHPGSRAIVGRLEEVLRTGEPVANARARWQTPGPGRDERWSLASYVPVRVGGAVEGAAVLVIDVTAQRNVERALAESERRFRSAVEGIPALVWMCRADGSLAFANEHFAEHLGEGRGAAFGPDWAASVHPDDLPGARARWARALAGGGPFKDELRLQRAGGEYRWFLAQATPLRDAGGRVEQWLGTATDVDDMRRAQAQLDALLEAAPVGMAILDPDLRYVRVNQALAELNGRPRDEHVGRRAPELRSELSDVMVPTLRKVLVEGEPVVDAEVSGAPPGGGGAARHWLATHYPVRVEGEVVGVASIVSEQTERKRAERRVRVLAAAGEVLAASLDERETVAATLRLLVPEVATVAAVYPAAEGGALAREAAVVYEDAGPERAARTMLWRLPAGEGHPIAEVHRTRRPALVPVTPAFVESVAEGGERRRRLEALGLRSGLAVPVVARGRSLGVLALGSARRPYGPADLRFAEELGGRLGLALDNARLYVAAEAERERIARLQAATAALSAARTLDEIAGVAVARGCAAFDAPRGLLGLIDGGGATLEIVRHAGYDEAAVEPRRRLPLDAPTPLSDAARSGEPVLLGSRREIAARYPGLERAPAKESTLLALPLVVGGRTIGCLGLSSDAPRRVADADRAELVAYARLCASAVERALLFDLAQAERRRAEEANRTKDEFLSVVSHELRTPLNAILGWSAMLRQGLSEAQAARALETIERNAKAQAQLVEDLLDISRITTGKVRLRVAPVDLAGVARAALDTLGPAAEAKGVRLAADLGAEPGEIAGDADRLQQVVWNLLTNAVKFTDRGGRVGVTLARAGAHLELAVEDSGRGIEPAFLPYVFERFRQAEGGTARGHGGLGLGLAIVRHLVELHGGSVRAESAGAGRGARFVVRLPAAAPAADEAPPAGPPPLARPSGRADALDLRGLRVLVVDDEPDAREMLATLLGAQGALASTAATAAEALERVRAERPDVIVSDVGMAVEDGYAFLERVRALPPEQGGRTPALALTAYARIEDRNRALLAGFQTHLPKPVEPAEFLAALAAVAGRRPPAPGAR